MKALFEQMLNDVVARSFYMPAEDDEHEACRRLGAKKMLVWVHEQLEAGCTTEEILQANAEETLPCLDSEFTEQQIETAMATSQRMCRMCIEAVEYIAAIP